MQTWADVALSFPTVVFTVLLATMLGYWLIALLGLVEFDAFDLSPGDADAGAADTGLFAGLLLKIGLDGVPLTVILTGIALIGWLLSYFAMLLLVPLLPFAALAGFYGAGVLLASLLLAVPLTGLALSPLQRLLKKIRPTDSVSLLGTSAVVRSPVVSLSQGSAHVDDGGAGLILQVRAEPGLFARGDRVVLVEYLEAQNAYRVIAEQAPVAAPP